MREWQTVRIGVPPSAGARSDSLRPHLPLSRRKQLLRPVLLTTTTAVLGLAPLALGLGAGAEIQAPLARVVVGGLTGSTLVTLVLIPVAYASATGLMTRLKARRWRPSDADQDEDRAVTA